MYGDVPTVKYQKEVAPTDKPPSPTTGADYYHFYFGRDDKLK